MSTTSSAGDEGWILPWYGFILGLCLLIPTLLRLQREGWTGVTIVFVTTGTALVIFCVTRLGIVLSRTLNSIKAETEGSGSP